VTAEGAGHAEIPLPEISGCGEMHAPFPREVADTLEYRPLDACHYRRISDITDLDLDDAADDNENRSPVDASGGGHDAPERRVDTPRRVANVEALTRSQTVCRLSHE
jgi:hypothetical protein